jgi:hypothetical protein
MLTLIYTLALMILLLSPLLWLHGWPYRQKRLAAKSLRQRFIALGIQHGLNFSSQEMLGDGMIGLDGQQRRLLVLASVAAGVFRSEIISLNEVQSCSLVRYHHEQQGSRPAAVHLQLTLPHRLPVEIVFYEEGRDKKNHWKELENKARQWEVLLGKMRKPFLPVSTSLS